MIKTIEWSVYCMENGVQERVGSRTRAYSHSHAILHGHYGEKSSHNTQHQPMGKRTNERMNGKESKQQTMHMVNG